jgi:hypothetical protein
VGAKKETEGEMIVQCCFVGCGASVDWADGDHVVADWLLFHVMTPDPDMLASGRILSFWLCPDHARKYGWKNLDLCKVKGGEPSSEELEVIANALELLRMEDPGAFDLKKASIPTLEAMRVRMWSISSTMIPAKAVA